MDIYAGERQSGRTTELIKISAETGAIIVVTSVLGIANIKYMAKGMKVNIPEPIDIREFLEHQYSRGKSHGRKYLLDNMDYMLDYLHVIGGAVNSDNVVFIQRE